MSLALLGTMRRCSRIILMASMWISMTLLMRASSGARGKAATKMVVKLYWIAVEGDTPGAGVKPQQKGCPPLPGFVLLCGLGQGVCRGGRGRQPCLGDAQLSQGCQRVGSVGRVEPARHRHTLALQPWPWKERKVRGRAQGQHSCLLSVLGMILASQGSRRGAVSQSSPFPLYGLPSICHSPAKECTWICPLPHVPISKYSSNKLKR